MQINTNLSALSSRHQLSKTEEGVARSLQRLSTGLRINSAKDDVAGLAISDRMTTQVRGLTQAARNANDGISMLQTAEGALGSSLELMQRIRELSVQAANASNSAQDRKALQSEVAQALAEIDRIGKTTAFNGQKVFAQTENSVIGDPDKLAVIDGLKSGWLENAEKTIQQYFGITGDGAGLKIDLSSFTDGASGTAARVVGSFAGYSGKASNVTLQIDMADFVPPNPPNGGTAPLYNDRIILHEMVHAVMYRSMNFGSMADPANDQKWFTEGVAEFIHGADERLSQSISSLGSVANLMAVASTFGSGTGIWGGTSDDYSAGYAAVRFLHQTIKDNGGEGIKDVLTYMAQNQNATLNDAINSATGGTYATADAFLTAFNAGGAAFISAMNLSDSDTGAIGGANADGGAIKTAENVISDVAGITDNPLSSFVEDWETVARTSVTQTQSLHIGAMAGQTLEINSGAMGTGALDLNDINVTTDATSALLKIDRAMEYVNSERANLGAQMNRLEAAVSNLTNSVENQSAARSRILDADFASETLGLARSQMLQQAAMAMTAQANSIPQNALTLLRF